MPPSLSARVAPSWLPSLVACVSYSVVIAAILPSTVVVRGDDFGYLEATCETIRHGTWIASDWLEPLNCLLPWISTGLFAGTGDLWWATMGLVACLAVANYLLVRAWIRPSGSGGELLVCAVALSPVFLNKTVEYTGVPLSILLTLGALIAWRNRWRVGFFFLVLLGIANRQSALCLLVLPAVELVRTLPRARDRSFTLAAGTLLVLIGTVWLLKASPPTFARALHARWLQEFSVYPFLGNLALGGVMVAGLRAAWDALRGEDMRGILRQNLARPGRPLALMAVGAWVVLGGEARLLCETPGLEPASVLVVVASTVAGAWMNRWHKGLPWEALAYTGAFVLLVALRGRWWDYYLLEPLLVLGWPAPTQEQRPLKRFWFAGAWCTGCLAYAALLGPYLSRLAEVVVDYEQALRSGTVSIVEASDAPFGFLAWKLFPAARSRGEKDAQLIDFLKFVEGGRARWTEDGIVVSREGARRSLHPSGEKWKLPSDWHDRRFPLSKEEWRTWLRVPPLPATPGAVQR